MAEQPERRSTATSTPYTEAFDLITQLFNANQRLAFAEDEYENAKANKKTCEAERDRLLLLINDAVPRLRERIMVSGQLDLGLPDLVEWKKDLAQKGIDVEIVGGANDGKKPSDLDEGIDPDDMTGTVIATNKGLRFGRFVAARLKDGPPAEWELECADCNKKTSRVMVPADQEAIVELRRSAKVHLQLFHEDGGTLPR